MWKINLVIEERPANVGSLTVGRLLPFRQKRMIGPFIYLDHLGPIGLSEDENFDVLPHPHIGLSTLTYLIEGRIVHRDTLGNEVEIEPGAVNWMTAGKGIVHSERTPLYLRHSDKVMHGLQIWVALPRELEQMEPAFFHIDKEQLPTWQEGALEIKLVAGEALGRKSSVPVYSKLFMLEIRSSVRQTVSIGSRLYGEAGLFVLEGGIESEGETFGPRQLLVADGGSLSDFTIAAESTVYIIGGEPFAEKRYIDWNFVSSDKALIEAAKQKWIDRAFETIRGEETEFIPYPSLFKQ